MSECKLEQMAEEYAPLDERSISTAYWQREGFKAGFQAALSLPEVKAMVEALQYYKNKSLECCEGWSKLHYDENQQGPKMGIYSGET